LYNGMINPITPFSFAGVVWYQGEQDSGRKEEQYHKMLQTLISDWRARFGTPLHFCICQLPNFGEKTASPEGSTWANIREAQRRALEIPATSLVTTIDLGEEDVHPPDKKPVGERIALSVLGSVYGQQVATAGPLFDSMRIEGDKAIISFRSTDGGLIAKPLPAEYLPTYSAKEKMPLVRNSPNSELEGFAIRGDDNKWHWALAKIDGDRVVVWSADVPSPTSVRYAWSDNPTCNLYNAAGLSASPFRAGK
jgi:sialate O-acetylesterase